MKEDQIVLKMMMDMLGGMVVIYAMAIAGAVFIGLCVYYDARCRGDDKAALWGVLSGFFSVAALVYLIVKLATKKKPAICARCGYPLPEGYLVCPNCWQPVMVGGRPLTPSLRDKWKRRRTRFLVLFIVCEVLAIIGGILLVMGLFRNAMALGLQMA